MAKGKKGHPLENYSEKEKVAYLSILSAICYVDKEFNDLEKQQLDSLLNQLNISDEGKGRIYFSLYSLQEQDKVNFLEIIENLHNSDLKYTLISDLCLFALSDSQFSDDEYGYIMEIAKHLMITREQVDAIKSVQENLFKIKNHPTHSEILKHVVEESASRLAGVGVPIAAIAVSGSTFGLSAAGITSGLAVLGGLVGGGMLAGAVVAVPAIAVGSAYGVRKLVKVIWTSK